MQESTPVQSPSPASRPPKKNNLTLIAVAAIAVVAMIIIVGVLLTSPGAQAQAYKPSAGDYLEYEMTSSGFISIESTVRMDITAADNDGYTVTITTTMNGEELSTETEVRGYSEPLGASDTDELGQKVGTETITTEFGTKKVYKYEFSEEDASIVFYIGVETNTLYRMETSSDMVTMTMELTATNIDFILDGDKP